MSREPALWQSNQESFGGAPTFAMSPIGPRTDHKEFASTIYYSSTLRPFLNAALGSNYVLRFARKEAATPWRINLYTSKFDNTQNWHPYAVLHFTQDLRIHVLCEHLPKYVRTKSEIKQLGHRWSECYEISLTLTDRFQWNCWQIMVYWQSWWLSKSVFVLSLSQFQLWTAANVRGDWEEFTWEFQSECLTFTGNSWRRWNGRGLIVAASFSTNPSTQTRSLTLTLQSRINAISGARIPNIPVLMF